MTKLIISLFVVSSYLAFHVCIQTNQMQEISDLARKSCGHCSVGQFSVRSKLACSMACSADTRCVTFSYVKQNKQCTLRGYILTTNDCEVNSNGGRHYRMIGRMVTPSSLYTYDAIISGWYRIESEAQTTWLEAQTICCFEGGHLLEVRSQTEQDWISQKLGSLHWADGRLISGTWIRYDQGAMVWSNLSPGYTGDCNALDTTHSDNRPCSDVYGYVCHKNVL